MMKRKYFLIAVIVAITNIGTIETRAQEYDRNVTVETEFQPIIQDAGKMNIKPVIQTTSLPSIPVTYSDFSNEVNPDFTPSILLSQPIHFTKPDTLNGLLRGGVGHINSAFLFAYTISDNKKNSLTIQADHTGGWGTKTLSDSKLNINFVHPFYNGSKFYLDLFGENQFFTRYGLYFDTTATVNDLCKAHYAELADSAKQVVWYGGAQFGFRSSSQEDLTYDICLGYDMVAMPSLAVEHHAKARLNIQWNNNEHNVGGNVQLQGNFYQMLSAIEPHNNRYNIRVEPYYEYLGSRFFIHIGANVDLNYGKGTQFSTVDRLAFAPSPNVRFEAQLAPKWVVLYGQATGRFALGNSEEFIKGNRYRDFVCSVTSLHTSSYTPIEGELGFRFRPEENLLFEIHGDYGMQWNKTFTIFTPGTRCLDYAYFNYNSGKVGAAFSYHYQDIITLHGWGDYLMAHRPQVEATSSLRKLDLSSVTPGRAYDCVSWKVGLDIDARIDQHWSLYSHNRFEGGRWTLIDTGNGIEDKKLAPWIEINLGCQYDFDNRLALYLDLNNLINRKNDIYYGYQTTGINFLLGVNWRF